jgi:4a-hydroxytetrahydrobiopterin dehydratase
MNEAADPGPAADARQEMALTPAEVAQLLPTLPGWVGEGKTISKTFRFRDHYETMAFVNALAWVSHRVDHHPDLAVGYNECKVSYTTHWLGGLSRKDFMCAAKAEALFTG